MKRRHARSGPWILAVLFAGWWAWVAAHSALGGPDWLWWLGVPLVLASAWGTAAAARARPLVVGVALSASPAVVMPLREFLRAAQSYEDGTARLIRVGLPADIPPFVLDEATRIPIFFSGCITNDVWNAHVWINNETVLWLTRSFGPMPGVYTGPLPTDVELFAAIDRHGVPLSGAYDAEQLWIDGDVHVLPHALALTLPLFGPNARAAVLHARLLVIDSGLLEDEWEGHHVFDLATGRYLDGALAGPIAEARPDLAPRWQRETLVALHDRR